MLTVNGKAWSCFERSSQEWRDLGHLVVDYRALLAWATWADGAHGRHRLELDNLEAHLAAARATADDATADAELARLAYADEHRLRLEVDALARARAPRWATITLATVAGLEALALGALSIALAAH